MNMREYLYLRRTFFLQSLYSFTQRIIIMFRFTIVDITMFKHVVLCTYGTKRRFTYTSNYLACIL